MDDGLSVPTGVKVVSVLYYIGAVFGIIFGLTSLVGAGMIDSIVNQIPLLGILGAGLFVIAGIILIGFGIFSFFIGRGLWKARPWARFVVIIIAALGILASVISMIQGEIASNIFNLVIQLAIVGYFLFSSNVKQAFA